MLFARVLDFDGMYIVLSLQDSSISGDSTLKARVEKGLDVKIQTMRESKTPREV